VDGGFNLDESTGAPTYGGGDFYYSGAKPPQLDEVDYDWTAGGIATGFANCPGGCWHGQMSFGACCANARNLFGGAGTSGGGTSGAEIYSLLIKVGPDVWQIATGVYDAIYNNADVINTSISFECGWMCRNFDDGNVLQAAVNSARNHGAIVVASAGNEGQDISNADRYPCEIDGAICVGAIVQDGTAWTGVGQGSNYGSVVDMWAPTGIYSTITETSANTKGDADDVGLDELAYFNGTSCSSPYLAGVVALMKTIDPFVYKSQVVAALQASANPSTDPKVSTGYVDALRALQELKPNAPPTVTITSHANGETVPYGGLYLGATAVDPEKSGPWGDEFDVTVTFSSNRQGSLCSDSGWSAPYSCESGPLALGTHVITARATDAFGASATDQVTVTVVNTPPIAKITYPPTAATVYTSQTISFAGYGYDPDEMLGPAGLTWSSDIDGALGTGPTIAKKLSAGIHTVKLTATDGLGATGTDIITVNVLEGAGYPSARIVSPITGSLFFPETAVTLVGEGADPEDGVLTGASLVWTSDIDGFLGTGQTVTVTPSGPGCTSTVHTITLTVTDSDGHVGTHSIQINMVEIC
jgi:hypothetical protein